MYTSHINKPENCFQSSNLTEAWSTSNPTFMKLLATLKIIPKLLKYRGHKSTVVILDLSCCRNKIKIKLECQTMKIVPPWSNWHQFNMHSPWSNWHQFNMHSPVTWTKRPNKKIDVSSNETPFMKQATKSLVWKSLDWERNF